MRGQDVPDSESLKVEHCMLQRSSYKKAIDFGRFFRIVKNGAIC
jgi:hypothetical protein